MPAPEAIPFGSGADSLGQLLVTNGWCVFAGDIRREGKGLSLLVRDAKAEHA